MSRNLSGRRRPGPARPPATFRPRLDGLEERSLPTANLTLTPVLSGLSNPLQVTNAADGTDRLFVAEQGGRILVSQRTTGGGFGAPTVFLDLNNLTVGGVPNQDRVISGGEKGLLGLAFHPNYETNGRFFVHYTVNDTFGGTNPNLRVNQVSEFRVSAGNPNVADPASEQLVLRFPPQPFDNHNGGSIEFGPDGFLYIAKGDGGSGGDPGNRAQDTGTDSNSTSAAPTGGTPPGGVDVSRGWFGKIHRIDVGSEATRPDQFTADPLRNYAIPSTNPFVGTAGRDEIWAFGLRNPFKISFDRGTGQLYAGDVGQGAREEIDVITRGGNYGWRPREGFIATPGVGEPTPPGAIDPITDLSRDFARSITGGYVYRGPTGVLPAGAYLFGDFLSGRVFLYENGVTTQVLTGQGNMASFGEDEAGELYVARFNGTVSRVSFVATDLGAGGFSDSGFDIPSTVSRQNGIPANGGTGNPSPWAFVGDAGATAGIAFVNGTGRVSQSLSLPAGTYTLSFTAANQTGTAAKMVRVLIDGVSPVTFNTPRDFTLTSTGQTYSTTFTVTTAEARTFTLMGLGAGSGILDNVRVDPAMPPPPPMGGVPGGGFEAPEVGSGIVYAPTGGPWVYSLNPGVAGSGVAGNGSAFGQPNAPEGDQVAFVQGAASITGAAPLALAAGNYRVTFQSAQFGGNGGNGPQRLRVTLAGNGLTRTAEVTPAGTTFGTTTADFFDLTAGNYTLSFLGLNASSGSVAFLDNVSIALSTSPPPPPPPPPPMGGLMGGGFEVPEVGSGISYPAGTAGPWTYNLNPGVFGSGLAGNGSGFGQPAAPEGDQVAFIQGGATIATAMPITLAAGTYRVTFQAAQWAGNGGNGPQRLSVRLTGSGGTQAMEVTPAGTAFGTVTADLTVAAGSYTLSFVGLNPSAGSVAFLDNASIALSTSPPPPPPPPPPMGGLMGGGFEVPEVGNGISYPAGTAGPWTYNLNPGVFGSGLVGNGGGFGQPNAPEGDQAAFVQGAATISTAMPIQLAAGTYRVTFQSAQWSGNGGNGPQRLQVRLTRSGGPTVTMEVTPAGTAYGMSTVVFGATAPLPAGDYTLSFVGLNPSAGSVAFIDSVALTVL